MKWRPTLVRSAAGRADGAVRFRIYPTRSLTDYCCELPQHLYFTTYVFPTKGQMQDFGEWRSPCDDGVMYEARVMSWPRLKVQRGHADRLKPKLGEVLLHRGSIGAELLSHEAVHVATNTARALAAVDNNWRGISREGIDDHEEVIAGMVGASYRQIVEGLFAAGILRESRGPRKRAA